MKKTLISKIKRDIQDIKVRYQKKYGAAVFDVRVKNINGSIVLNGVVLSAKQKNEIFLAVKDIIDERKIENKIKVLNDPKENLEIGWGAVNADIADIWVNFPDKKKPDEKSLATCGERSRASQAVKGDFVRVLAEKGNWRLIQTADLAMGWADSSLITMSKWETVKKDWIKAKRAYPGETIRKHLAKNIQSKFFHFLKKYLNAPYLLGGMTEKGIDCSGLTERFYSDIFGIILPRHSGDQAMRGEKIELGASHFGDLVYLRDKAKKQSHIGVVVEKFETSKNKRQNFDNLLILNARQGKGATVIEDLPEILKSYDLISIKRIIREF